MVVLPHSPPPSSTSCRGGTCAVDAPQPIFGLHLGCQVVSGTLPTLVRPWPGPATSLPNVAGERRSGRGVPDGPRHGPLLHRPWHAFRSTESQDAREPWRALGALPRRCRRVQLLALRATDAPNKWPH
eukprot:scaffold107419_cov65-Phaeocystis_antarctica.AAC.3